MQSKLYRIISLIIIILTPFNVSYAKRVKKILMASVYQKVDYSKLKSRYIYTVGGQAPAPSVLYKIDLNTLSVIDSLTLSESYVVALNIGPEKKYLYALTVTDPAKIIKIDLSSFTEIDKLTLSYEGSKHGLIHDSTYLYASIIITLTTRGIARINLNTFTETPETITLESDNVEFAINIAGGYLYAVNGGYVHKIRLADFIKETTVNYSLTAPGLYTVDIDLENNKLYAGTRRTATNNWVLKIEPSDLSIDKILTYSGTENAFHDNVVDSTGGYVYFCNEGAGVPMTVYKFDLATFTEQDSLQLSTGDESCEDNLVIDNQKENLYVISYLSGKLYKISLSNFSITGSLDTGITYPVYTVID